MLHDELEAVSFLASDIHLFVSSIGLAKQDVLFDGRIEKHWLLHHVAALITNGKHIVTIERLAVDCHFAFEHIVEAKKDVGQGALTTA